MRKEPPPGSFHLLPQYPVVQYGTHVVASGNGRVWMIDNSREEAAVQDPDEYEEESEP